MGQKSLHFMQVQFVQNAEICFPLPGFDKCMSSLVSGWHSALAQRLLYQLHTNAEHVVHAVLHLQL